MKDDMIAGMPRELVLPLIGAMAKKSLAKYAAEMQPAVKLPDGVMGSGPKTFARLYAEMLHAYIHEEGHARMMLHLNPSAAPMIRLIIEPTLCDEGAGVQIKGGACGTAEDISDPRERIMISVAGFLAETRALGHVVKDDDPRAMLFTRMNAGAACAMWAMDEFTKAFEGCMSDHEEVRNACRAWLPEDAPDPEDEANAEIVKAMASAVAEKLKDAMDAAMRVIDAQASDIVQKATLRANQHFGVVMKAMAGIGPHINRMRAACVGAFTDADMEALTDGDLAPPASLWRK